MTTDPTLPGADLRKLVIAALEDSDIDLANSDLSEAELFRYLAGLSDDRQSRNIEDRLGSEPELAARIEAARETCESLMSEENLAALEKSIRKSVDRAAGLARKAPSGGSLYQKLSDGLRRLFQTELDALPALLMTPATATGQAHAGEPDEQQDQDRKASVQARIKNGNLAVTVTSLACDESGNPIDEGQRLRFACDQSPWTAEAELHRPFPDADFVQASVRVAAGSEGFPEGAQLIVQLFPNA